MESSSPSSLPSSSEYDVFLSFRGPDTRKGFTDLLYHMLIDAGIRVFRDDEELRVGEEIGPKLMQAIEDAKVSIPIISKDYASSRFCLMELVQILERRKTMSQEIIPIFYEIEISDLRHQRNSFEESFLMHARKGVDGETIKKWKQALEEIAMIPGFEMSKMHDNGHLIRELIRVILQKLKKGQLFVTGHLVGVDHHVQEIMRKLGVVHRDGQVIEISGSDVRVLGIYGPGGVGKTTLAKIVYNQLSDCFQCCSYLHEIRELCENYRNLDLQNQLISDLQKRSVRFESSDDAMFYLAERFRNKQVLIILDDVEDVDQLHGVAGDLRWFGPGSRIIVTSRKSHILSKFKEAETYEVEPMEEDKALELFSKQAFGRDSPPSKDFESLSRDIILAIGRLPLALEVTGSYLYNKSEPIWKEMLEKLKEASNEKVEPVLSYEKVEPVLQISYDALDKNAKQIFLDIARNFIGKDENIVFYTWEHYNHYPFSGIEALFVSSLVKIGEKDELLMHDLLRTLARKIGSNEDPIPRDQRKGWGHATSLSLSTPRKEEESSSTSSLPSSNEYDVFLSFGGPDIRRGFADFLYHALIDAGIRVFRDDEELPVGEKISPKLMQAIEDAKVSIPIISRDYASSRSCLMELFQIIQCRKTMSREIIPIFYDVRPSEVRYQMNSFGKSFSKHERKGVDSETIEKWKWALQEISMLLGFETAKIHGDWQLIKELIPVVLQKLKKLKEAPHEKCEELEPPNSPFESLGTSVASIEHVVGIDDRVKDVIKLLEVVRIVGIHGTSGIGKTTIAKAVYDRLSSWFNSCSFLSEIGETTQNGGGIQCVQTKLIRDILERDGDVASFEGGIKFFLDVFSNIKALIVLDDVEKQSHLDELVGNQLDWFGSGSRIIVTSENGEILKTCVSRGRACIYEVNQMDNDRALELFCKHALGKQGLTPDYLEIGKHIIKATGGVPLVIEVIGSFLRGKTMEEFRKMEDLIKPQPEKSPEILKNCQEILKICYEALDEKQKQIFWDTAQFANGMDSRIALYMWSDRDILPSHHVLMPLAKIGGDNMLYMHKLLKRLSEAIDQEEPKYRGKRRRLSMHDTDLKVINRKEGEEEEEVEALCFDTKNGGHPTLTESNFKSKPNIRFLKLDHASMTGNFANVFPKLRWLRWQGCPRDFEATEFNLTELVILDLSWSKVTEDWGGWREIKMEQLKVLNLTGCTDLLISPTFSSLLNLEILILERCSRLVHLDPSVGGLKKLLCLNLKSCTELNVLPAELGGLEALRELLIDETSVRDIPWGSDSKKLEHLTSLATPSADNSKISELPDGIGELVKLRRLSLRNCHWIRELPESIGQLGSSLEELDISGTGISKFPDSFGNLQKLRVLKMDYCFISKFPSFIWRLHSLEEIHASLCRNLVGEIPGDIRELKNLRILRLQDSAISSLPPEIKDLPKLETLDPLHGDMLPK